VNQACSRESRRVAAEREDRTVLSDAKGVAGAGMDYSELAFGSASVGRFSCVVQRTQAARGARTAHAE